MGRRGAQKSAHGVFGGEREGGKWAVAGHGIRPPMYLGERGREGNGQSQGGEDGRRGSEGSAGGGETGNRKARETAWGVDR